MKKMIIVSLLLCMIFIITGCSNKRTINLKDNFLVETIENKNCSGELTEYYNFNNQKLYLYCIKRINLYDDENAILLKDYIEVNNYNIEEVIKKITSRLKLEEVLWDGGTKIYRDTNENKISNNGLTIIECNTVDSNKNVYIGTKQMEYKSEFCQNK